jgi:hypothetical protein
VPDEVRDHSALEPLRELLNGSSDIPQAGAGLHLVDAELQAPAGDFGDLLGVFARGAHVKRRRSVTVEALIEVRDIHVDDVSVDQLLSAGDAVTDHVVHRRADALWKAEVVERGRARTLAQRVSMDKVVDFIRRQAGANDATDRVQRFGGHAADSSHVLDLSCGFDVDAPVAKQHGSLVCRLGSGASSSIVQHAAHCVARGAVQRRARAELESELQSDL